MLICSKFFLFAFSKFLKYLSIGNDPGQLPITYSKLETIELYQVSFEDMKEILVVLRLITSSPNLKELQISVCPYEFEAKRNMNIATPIKLKPLVLCVRVSMFHRYESTYLFL